MQVSSDKLFSLTYVSRTEQGVVWCNNDHCFVSNDGSFSDKLFFLISDKLFLLAYVSRTDHGFV
jgi:hypothetical protein